LSSIIPREAYRAAYHAQQRALLYQCLAGHQVLRKLTGIDMKPTKSAVRDARARYASLLASDLTNVEEGYYPRELLFQVPVSDYLLLFPKLVSDFPRTIWVTTSPGSRKLREFAAGTQPSFERAFRSGCWSRLGAAAPPTRICFARTRSCGLKT
jgi:hypothetical protein